jgi:proteasome lid subunit RPN8/RPN11
VVVSNSSGVVTSTVAGLAVFPSLLVQVQPSILAVPAGTHVTFTQDTWEHIYKVKDSEYPDDRIVGWYHSHPGFGVFLSDHDTFIHKNFFSSEQQVAWVYDPHSDEEGCFGWVGKRLERLSQFSISDGRGGEEAGETGKPEPTGFDYEEEPEIIFDDRPVKKPPRPSEAPRWIDWTISIVSHLLIFVVGALAAMFLLRPSPQVIFVDMNNRSVNGPFTIEQAEQIMRGYGFRLALPGESPGAIDGSRPPAAAGDKGDHGKPR